MFCFQLVFEGVRGSSYTSDIAIDDFNIVPGRCQPAGSCNFETGLCGYTNDRGDEFDWTRGNGGTPSDLTGPHNDHTTNSPAGLPSSEISCLMFGYDPPSSLLLQNKVYQSTSQ